VCTYLRREVDEQCQRVLCEDPHELSVGDLDVQAWGGRRGQLDEQTEGRLLEETLITGGLRRGCGGRCGGGVGKVWGRCGGGVGEVLSCPQPLFHTPAGPAACLLG
jgi:hypothetical protein